MAQVNNRISEIDAIIAQYDLNTHPFYEAWRMGTLPAEKLSRYASEYGQFVKTIGNGWNTVGMGDYVEEEALHVELWSDFRNELAAPDQATNRQTHALTAVAENLFALPAESVGALYAFEAQQPSTASSKLDGLKEHFNVSTKAQEYFKVHARQHSEYGDLQVMLGELSDDDFARAKTACSMMCIAMWSGLDGVYYQD